MSRLTDVFLALGYDEDGARTAAMELIESDEFRDWLADRLDQYVFEATDDGQPIPREKFVWFADRMLGR